MKDMHHMHIVWTPFCTSVLSEFAHKWRKKVNGLKVKLSIHLISIGHAIYTDPEAHFRSNVYWLHSLALMLWLCRKNVTQNCWKCCIFNDQTHELITRGLFSATHALCTHKSAWWKLQHQDNEKLCFNVFSI